MELLRLKGFPAERFDFPNPHQRVLHVAVHIGYGRADPAERRPHLASEIRPVKHHEREGNQTDQRKRWTVDEHQDIGADDRRQTDQKILRAMVRHLGDNEQIVGDPAHHVTGLGPIEISERKPLKVGKQLITHIRFHLHPEDMPPSDPDILTDGLDQVDCEHEDKDHYHRPKISGGYFNAQEVPGQRREQNGKDGRQHRHPQIQQEQTLVGAIVRDKTLQHHFPRFANNRAKNPFLFACSSLASTGFGEEVFFTGSSAGC
ncbi:MAG: hypothetical protein BWY50_00918 [Spirochaetes bacterium ADurb.Bin315]|nr:MAG: hypothetical protein BWY50_00918 [Spirochaetes bacterium ADurb.Bin315]